MIDILEVFQKHQSSFTCLCDVNDATGNWYSNITNVLYKHLYQYRLGKLIDIRYIFNPISVDRMRNFNMHHRIYKLRVE